MQRWVAHLRLVRLDCADPGGVKAAGFRVAVALRRWEQWRRRRSTGVALVCSKHRAVCRERALRRALSLWLIWCLSRVLERDMRHQRRRRRRAGRRWRRLEGARRWRLRRLGEALRWWGWLRGRVRQGRGVAACALLRDLLPPSEVSGARYFCSAAPGMPCGAAGRGGKWPLPHLCRRSGSRGPREWRRMFRMQIRRRYECMRAGARSTSCLGGVAGAQRATPGAC